MKGVIHRIFIVCWLISIYSFGYTAFDSGLFDKSTFEVASFLILPTWILQFVFTGIINPIKLTKLSN